MEEIERIAKQYGLLLKLNTEKEKLRVLIVDDDRQMTEFLSELYSGYQDFVVCEHGFDGLEAGHKLHTFINPRL